MGIKGIEVVKEFVDMVLVDDDFVDIVVVVCEGCYVFDNICKMICFLFLISFVEGFVVIISILMGYEFLLYLM